ncbi:4-hydroxy-tetrahydrodipicolinate synthase [Streptococcus penaeicida]|uniref:4-hydroxy-tetrahydrodipicolinate synthase n=1 Tax=Streptococcus penaeicida TaxID=1765960 RepID=A0A2N8LCT7_9STRE|nr:4-hydroxy-tetrahydrodipicolinate synthase [Streptococcus penaeicida]PND47983.1 4-hydroxy-tetrahydrodipicolinate synthase [Streptococcus penaeicida]
MSLEELQNCQIITALVTPFNADGSINFTALPKLIEYLLDNHSQALLLAGTTAESPTLTHEEELELFAEVQKIVDGRVPLIAGIGTNDTRDSVDFAKEVAEFGGFSAGLAIVPYYNKPSQEGLYQHFKAIADASSLPIIIYNIPGRVVVDLHPDTLLRLANHPNIIGVKDCSNLDHLGYLIENKPKDFLIYTGEDGQAFHAMNLGADGLISVASHTNGPEIFDMFTAISENDIKKAAQIQRRFLPKVNALFSQPSPAPVKAVLNELGFAVGPLRLPLVACNRQEAEAIINIVLDKAPQEYSSTGVLRPDY